MLPVLAINPRVAQTTRKKIILYTPSKCAAWCLLTLLLQSCVFVPITTTKYDQDCHILARHMTMEPVQIAHLSSCTNSQCTEFMVVAGLTVAASAVISGSIVIVGNVVYWMEKQGRCLQVR
ncbi:MAG: hypothetical protein PHI29_09445 [Gallionella sp.]|nr:hypothetical protein [Gallionella sp.]